MPRQTQTKPTALRTRKAIIHILKQQEAQDAATLAAQLELSPMAVRQHLYELQAQGLVAYEEQARPLGRPAKLWRLTPAADRFFPDGHQELSLDLIGAMKQTFGDAGLERLVKLRSREQVKAYRARIKADASLAKRLAALAEIRTEEGYMAAAREDGKDAYLLVENHCPICSAAAACSGLCAGELEVFQKVLGRDVQIERTEHILAGARRCAYRVTRR